MFWPDHFYLPSLQNLQSSPYWIAEFYHRKNRTSTFIYQFVVTIIKISLSDQWSSRINAASIFKGQLPHFVFIQYFQQTISRGRIVPRILLRPKKRYFGP